MRHPEKILATLSPGDTFQVNRILDFLKNPPPSRSGRVYEVHSVDPDPDHQIYTLCCNRTVDPEEDRFRTEPRPAIRMTLANLKLARALLPITPDADAAAIERATDLIRETIRVARIIKRRQREGTWN